MGSESVILQQKKVHKQIGVYVFLQGRLTMKLLLIRLFTLLEPKDVILQGKRSAKVRLHARIATLV